MFFTIKSIKNVDILREIILTSVSLRCKARGRKVRGMPVSQEQLKEKYKKLSRHEKEITGTALLKVNLGVGLPQDFKIVAQFLKGTGLVAKPGTLEDLIQFLHAEEGKKDIPHKKIEGGTVTTSKDALIPEDGSVLEGLKEFKEDFDLTQLESDGSPPKK